MFTKQDLKIGMVCLNREGNMYVVMPDFSEKDELILMREDYFCSVSGFNEDLTNDGYEDLDIMKVWKQSNNTLEDILQVDEDQLVYSRLLCQPDKLGMIIKNVSLRSIAQNCTMHLMQGEIIKYHIGYGGQFCTRNDTDSFVVPADAIVEKEN